MSVLCVCLCGKINCSMDEGIKCLLYWLDNLSEHLLKKMEELFSILCSLPSRKQLSAKPRPQNIQQKFAMDSSNRKLHWDSLKSANNQIS